MVVACAYFVPSVDLLYLVQMWDYQTKLVGWLQSI